MRKTVDVTFPKGYANPKIKPKITVLFWYKKPKEKVKKGEELVEVQTDKAIMDIEAPVSGKVSAIMAEAGSTIKPGQKIGEIEICK